jgi:hypothetical protein
VKIRFLLDENLDPRIKAGLIRRYPSIDILRVGDDEAPPRGTLDPDLLRYVELTQRLLVTNNRASMPVHVAHHSAAGGRHWGIFRLSKRATIGSVIEAMCLLWEASEAEEWVDRLQWLPL